LTRPIQSCQPSLTNLEHLDSAPEQLVSIFVNGNHRGNYAMMLLSIGNSDAQCVDLARFQSLVAVRRKRLPFETKSDLIPNVSSSDRVHAVRLDPFRCKTREVAALGTGHCVGDDFL